MFSFLLSLTLSLTMNANVEKPKLIYVGDPMCSWCYGISEELSKTVHYYEDKVDLQVILGGLRAGGGDQWNQQFRSFLRQHWEEVGAKSGQPFSFEMLDKEYFNYDTEPACRAVVVAQKIAPEKALEFFKQIQKRFYLDAQDPKMVEFYEPICNELNINFKQFSESFRSDEAKIDTKHHFYQSRKLGVSSFPTILLKKDGAVYKIASGYATFEQMKTRIDSLIQ